MIKFKKRNLLKKIIGFKTIDVRFASSSSRLVLFRSLKKLFSTWKRSIITNILNSSNTDDDFKFVSQSQLKNIKQIFKKIIITTSRIHSMHFTKSYEQLTGLKTDTLNIDIDNLIKSYLPEYEEGVKKSYSKFLKNIGEVVKEHIGASTGYRAGDYPTTQKTLKDILIEKFDGLTEKRAKFLARDQSAKINATINQQTQQLAGIKYFRWKTLKDSRVSTGKGGHDKLDGKIYAWDDLANLPIIDAAGHRGRPSERPNCRCTAEAVIILPGYTAKQLSDGSYKIVKQSFKDNDTADGYFSFSSNSENWITVKGNHIKLKDGETKEEAVKRFIEEKEKSDNITYDPKGLNLYKTEYGAVHHEINNNVSKKKLKRGRIIIHSIDNYTYLVKVKKFV